jgi:hypothetical protein
MRNYIISILIAITIFCSCETPIKNYSLQKLDSFSFRRNYFGADTLTGKALEKFMNRKPVSNQDYKEKGGEFYTYLTKEKIIHEYRLDLTKLDTLPDDFSYTLKNKKIAVSTSFSYIEEENTNNYILTFKDAETTILKDTLTFDFPPDVIFSKFDLDKNGTDELFALYKNYAINGHNFELSIYELK